MASGAAASVKLCVTGLQRPRILTVKIELMSACGAKRTWSMPPMNVRFAPIGDIARLLALREFAPRAFRRPPDELAPEQDDGGQRDPSVSANRDKACTKDNYRHGHRQIVRAGVARIQAVPLQVRAPSHITGRAGTGGKTEATMAACGIHQAKRLVRGLRNQSRELRAMSDAMIALPSTTGGRSGLTRALGLNRRARHRPVRAEYAAITLLWPQHRAAAGALVEELA